MAAVPSAASLSVVQTAALLVVVPSPPHPQLQRQPLHPLRGVPFPADPLHLPFPEVPFLEEALSEGVLWGVVPVETQAAFLLRASLATSPQVLSAGLQLVADLLAGVPSEAPREPSPVVRVGIPEGGLVAEGLVGGVPVLQLG